MPRKAELGDRVVKVPIALPADLYEWLREHAFARRVPMAQVVREALDGYRGAEVGRSPRGELR